MIDLCWHRYTNWSKLTKTYESVYQYKQCKKCGIVIKIKGGITLNYSLEDFDGTEFSHKEKNDVQKGWPDDTHVDAYGNG